MKKIILPLLLLITLGLQAQRQPAFRLNAYAGYVFDDKVSTGYYNGTINGNFQWGAGFEYMLNPYQGLELCYLRQDTKAPTRYGSGGLFNNQETFDLAMNYILLGTTRYIPTRSKFEPYFGAQAGIGIVDVSNTANSNDGSESKFAWGLKAGTNIWVSDAVGIKLQAGLQSITQAFGGGVYFGPGGVGTGVSSYSTIYQFSLGGGLAFKFGGSHPVKTTTTP